MAMDTSILSGFVFLILIPKSLALSPYPTPFSSGIKNLSLSPSLPGSTIFKKRLNNVFDGAASLAKGGNPDSNTLISDTTTVICLDDYQSLDRTGRKAKGVTALDPQVNDFDLMYEQVKALKDGVAVEMPIYNHVTSLLDAPELIKSSKILVFKGLHLM
ncbi:phosphoribulokinase, chloroplastic-like [Lactuca sativa]|uniref:phosphoribulokinase, chloroplastic-like n=1 Tax=Lactuca sativa TaxID=4236 RepID=UPI000CD8B5B9|nr:phosphoribulokinase, chloroplastic-like [Lactuca sativa]